VRNADYLDVAPISVAAYLATGVAARFTAPKGIGGWTRS
jgi:hypothetical protein